MISTASSKILAKTDSEPKTRSQLLSPSKARLFIVTLLVLSLIIQTSPIRPRAWQLGASGLELIQLPNALQHVEPLTQGDLNLDGKPEKLSLNNGQALLYSDENLVWQSPPEWNVTQAALTDLDHDGKVEATLLVWREFRPWLVDDWLPHGGRIATFHDAQNQSCHIILIGWTRGAYHELWAGSALANPIISFAAADLDGDGVEELATLEGDYATRKSGLAHTLKIWRWNYFGFNAVTSIEGTFHQMTLSKSSEGRHLVLTP